MSLVNKSEREQMLLNTEQQQNQNQVNIEMREMREMCSAARIHEKLINNLNNKHDRQLCAQKSSSQWSKLLILVGLTATLGAAIPIGFANGVMNNPANVIKDWIREALKKNYNLELTSSALDIMWSSVVSIHLVGGTIGSLCGSWSANKFGRKGSFLISGSLNSIGAAFVLLCRLVDSVEMLFLGRLFVGFACGLTTTVLPMYLVELAPLTLRGTLGVMVSVGVNIGMVIGQVISLGEIFGTAELWQYALSFYLIFVLLSYVAAIFYPESPKYLYVVCNDREGAFQVLSKLRETNNTAIIDAEIDDMMQETSSSTQSRSMWSVIRDPALLIPLIIVCSYQAGQQFSGINAVFYYSVSIFERAGFKTSVAQWANLGCGVLNLIVALQSPWIMAKINRRPIMLTSLGGCTIFLICITVFLSIIDEADWYSVACIVCILGYILFYQIGLGPVAYFVGSEIFEVEPRPAAMGLGSLASWASNFIIGMCFPLLQNAWGAYVFLPFAVICILLYLLTQFYLPESRGRDSSEVASLVANGFRSKIK